MNNRTAIADSAIVNGTSDISDRILRLRGDISIGTYKQFVLQLIALRSIYGSCSRPLPVTWSAMVASRDPVGGLTALQYALHDGQSALNALTSYAPNASLTPKNLLQLLQILEPIEKPSTLAAIFDDCLENFAELESRSESDYFTPSFIRRLILQTAAPKSGVLYDPCCGTGGLLLSARAYSSSLSLVGQESNPSTWNLCQARLAVHGVDADVGRAAANTFQRDMHAGLQAKWVVANPPFNQSFWAGEMARNDARFALGLPPEKNANFAWIQLALSHLCSEGTAVLVLPNSTLSSSVGGEDSIRRKLIEMNYVDCIVSLPKYQFNAARVYACIWILSKSKSASTGRRRSKDKQTLFIDAQSQTDSQSHVLSDALISRVADAYHAWRETDGSGYADCPGFCRAAGLEEIASHEHLLTPGRYVASPQSDEHSDTSSTDLKVCIDKLNSQFLESARLEREIQMHLQCLSLES